MSFETERYVSKIKELEYEIKVLRMALVQHGELVERLSEAENLIMRQFTDGANEYKEKYNLEKK